MAIPINDKLKPRNNAGFALMDAEDIECRIEYNVNDEVNIKIGRLPEFLYHCLTEKEYNALKIASKNPDFETSLPEEAGFIKECIEKYGNFNTNTPYLIIDE